MTPQEALIELLARTAAGNGAPAFVSDEELSRWPARAIVAMKSLKLLARVRPATCVVCPGCEQECVMPVHSLARADGAPVAFVVCDKRNDINRVPVSAGRLKQWQCDGQAVVAFVATSLGLRRSSQRAIVGGSSNVGMVSGSKRTQMLSLRVDGNEWSLVAGSSALLLADVIDYANGVYTLDAVAVGRLADSSTSVDPRHTPRSARRENRKLETRARHQGWRKAYRELRKRRPDMSDVWYSQQLAKQDVAAGASAETIRKQIRK
jgi:hypothetical protein